MEYLRIFFANLFGLKRACAKFYAFCNSAHTSNMHAPAFYGQTKAHTHIHQFIADEEEHKGDKVDYYALHTE